MGKIVVVHPDLGIGGAERLIVDASKALQECGHDVQIYTGYHDKTRCFKETADGTLKIFTVGGWIPRSIFGKCHALMAYAKMIYIAIYLLIFSRHDTILCDQVSSCISILKLDIWNKPRIIFYCHFPDQLLTRRDTLIKSLYRKPIDYFEEFSTRAADIILVNSRFTSSVVRNTFKSLRNRELITLYPCVSVSDFTDYEPKPEKCCAAVRKCLDISLKNYTFLSLNRFERKKGLELAIEALSECMLGYMHLDKGGSMSVHLILAGGYDERLSDSVEYLKELESLVNEFELNSHVSFIKSPSDNEKLLLLQMSHTVIYTPKDEHFGIVPLEAMAMSKPVIASASGGPLETIETEENGILCEYDKYSFADAMLRLFSDRELGTKMGSAGLERVKKNFSHEAFRKRLNAICYPEQN